MSTVENNLPQLLEALILSANSPLTEAKILSVFEEEEKPSLSELREALYSLQEQCEDRGYELVELASGYTFVAKTQYAKWIQKLWEEKPPKYSRALLETLAIIAYRQPVTRGEIEEIRGVSVSSSIFKTLQEERGWIRVIGHREVPGKPGIYATTKEFLDYFGLNSLDQLPPVSEILQSFEREEENNNPKQEELELEAQEVNKDDNNSTTHEDEEAVSEHEDGELIDDEETISEHEDKLIIDDEESVSEYEDELVDDDESVSEHNIRSDKHDEEFVEDTLPESIHNDYEDDSLELESDSVVLETELEDELEIAEDKN